MVLVPWNRNEKARRAREAQRAFLDLTVHHDGKVFPFEKSRFVAKKGNINFFRP
jgi:hypothetical protein